MLNIQSINNVVYQQIILTNLKRVFILNNQPWHYHLKGIMSSLAKSLIGLGIIVICMSTHARAADKIYRWQDEHNDLTNYAAIPPDDQMGSGSLKIYSPEIGVASNLNLPVRTLSEAEQDLLPSMVNKPVGKAIAGSPAIINKPISNAEASAAVKTAVVVTTAESVNKPTTTIQPRLLSQGSSQTINPIEEIVAQQKISQQVEKIEENVKTAQRIAEDKRREEMQVLAERVRNGAATKKEIAALITYRQTASFKDARSAMALPTKVKAMQKQQQFE